MIIEIPSYPPLCAADLNISFSEVVNYADHETCFTMHNLIAVQIPDSISNAKITMFYSDTPPIPVFEVLFQAGTSSFRLSIPSSREIAQFYFNRITSGQDILLSDFYTTFPEESI